MTAIDIDRLEKMEREVERRLLFDDDPPQIARDLGANPVMVGAVRDTMPTMGE